MPRDDCITKNNPHAKIANKADFIILLKFETYFIGYINIFYEHCSKIALYNNIDSGKIDSCLK
jgi:hypothetical protein